MVSLLWYNHAFSHVSDDLRRTPETAPSNLRGSIETRLRTTVLSSRTSEIRSKTNAWLVFQLSGNSSKSASCDIINKLLNLKSFNMPTLLYAFFHDATPSGDMLLIMQRSALLSKQSYWQAFIIKCKIKTYCTFRGVTRLDGARGKKQVWRPHVRTWVFTEANVLYRRKYLWHCWDFSAPT